MSGPLRSETLRADLAMGRLQQLGAELVKRADDGTARTLYFLPRYGLYAVAKRTLGGVWIGYYKDRNACGCG
jgi:hypothetical protein